MTKQANTELAFHAQKHQTSRHQHCVRRMNTPEGKWVCMARNEGHEGAESFQSSLESCQLLSLFGEMLLDDRYRNIKIFAEGPKWKKSMGPRQ